MCHPTVWSSLVTWEENPKEWESWVLKSHQGDMGSDTPRLLSLHTGAMLCDGGPLVAPAPKSPLTGQWQSFHDRAPEGPEKRCRLTRLGGHSRPQSAFPYSQVLPHLVAKPNF